MNENLKQAQKDLIVQYTAELEGELTKEWAKICNEYELEIDEYDNLLYAMFATGFIKGCEISGRKWTSLLGLKSE